MMRHALAAGGTERQREPAWRVGAERSRVCSARTGHSSSLTTQRDGRRAAYVASETLAGHAGPWHAANMLMTCLHASVVAQRDRFGHPGELEAAPSTGFTQLLISAEQAVLRLLPSS